jgi:hypothetical protein
MANEWLVKGSNFGFYAIMMVNDSIDVSEPSALSAHCMTIQILAKFSNLGDVDLTTRPFQCIWL